jgi:catechol 2,3-dioxygenase-like lactoylglutathione lyase family enzyme
MNVYKISAVTLLVSDLPKSFNFYYKIPGFKIRYKIDNFVSFQLTNSNEIDNKNSNIRNYKNKTYLNIELRKQDSVSATHTSANHNKGENATIRDRDATYPFGGRIIFYVDNVDELYSYFLKEISISNDIHVENSPVDAPWRERFFHVTDPDGHQLSFAQPL